MYVQRTTRLGLEPERISEKQIVFIRFNKTMNLHVHVHIVKNMVTRVLDFSYVNPFLI